MVSFVHEVVILIHNYKDAPLVVKGCAVIRMEPLLLSRARVANLSVSRTTWPPDHTAIYRKNKATCFVVVVSAFLQTLYGARSRVSPGGGNSGFQI